MLIIAAILCAQSGEPVPVRIGGLTLKRAELIDGRTVAATFTVGMMPFTWGEGKSLRTVTAPRSTGGTDHTVILKGDRLHDADIGARVTVVGTLRVIRHPTAMMGAMRMAEWTEIRIEEK